MASMSGVARTRHSIDSCRVCKVCKVLRIESPPAAPRTFFLSRLKKKKYFCGGPRESWLPEPRKPCKARSLPPAPISPPLAAQALAGLEELDAKLEDLRKAGVGRRSTGGVARTRHSTDSCRVCKVCKVFELESPQWSRKNFFCFGFESKK